MTSRVLSSVTLTAANNTFYVSSGGPGLEILTVDAGTYFFSLDNSGSDLGLALESALTDHSNITTAQIAVYGVDITGANADGRIYIDCDVDFSLDFSEGGWTLDKRIFGYPADHGSDESSTSTVLDPSDYGHLGGWYPQITADWHPAVRGSWAEASGADATHAVEVVDWGQYERIDLEWLVVLSGLIRTAGAADSTRAGQVNLTTGDTVAPLEAFVRHLVLNPTETWRYYHDATDTATYNGDYRFPGDSSLWQDPLALSSVLSRAGEEWTARLEGIRGPL